MLGLLIWLAVIAATAAVVIIVLRLIFPVPSTAGRQTEQTPPPDLSTKLARSFARDAGANPGKSGIIELASGGDAMSSRLLLIEAAERTLDAQYYIWQDDTSGRLLFKAVLAAANRGVKVRLLLDDNGVDGLDGIMASLDAHPNIDIRLFNPSTVRSPKLAGYAFDFFRMNRRMHNKAMIADGVAAIIGGRNIGDVYFDVGDGAFYFDLDALAVGTVAADATREFDLYWNSESAIAADLILTATPGDAAAQLATQGPSVSEAAERDTLQRYEGFRNSLGDTPRFEWVDAQIMYDHPAKGLGKAKGDQLLISMFPKVIGDATSHAELASAYFVPGRRGVESFASIAARGVKLRILTNAAEANDVPLVHTGYMRYRKALLEAGVELFEMRRVGPLRERRVGVDLEDLTSSSSASSLHAKTFAIDGERIFIGSFNFDPRSVTLNCEMGMLIHSPRLASQLTEAFGAGLARVAYQLRLRDGELTWVETASDGTETVHDTEPNTTRSGRFVLWVISLLPIEWLL